MFFKFLLFHQQPPPPLKRKESICCFERNGIQSLLHPTTYFELIFEFKLIFDKSSKLFNFWIQNEFEFKKFIERKTYITTNRGWI